ncbi:MAG: ABC transporter substrate-binding protein [Lentisphaerae bacterium]|nr:ABC transporter substrate-binding protein [Lentisphaerota bacterium]
MMKSRWVLAALGSVLLFAAGCRKERAAAPIRIGALFAVTGPASFLGAPEEKAARMLVDQINAEGGIGGRPIELICKDTAGDPDKCVSFARQLIDEDQVAAIIGPSNSGETMKIKAICEEARVPLVSCAAAEVIVNPVARYVFKTPQKDSQAVTWIFNTAKARGLTRIGILTDNTGFGAAGKEQLESLAAVQGMEILASEVFDKKATDLTDILTKLKGREVQAVVNWSIVPAQSIVPRNMKQLGMDVPLFQSHGFGNIKYVEQAGQAADGILFPASRILAVDKLPAEHPQKAVLMAFKKAYEERWQEPVSAFGGYAYDAVMLIAEAIRAKGAERDQIRDGLEGLTGVVGTTGIFSFTPEDHNGLGLDCFEMLTVKDGQFVLLEP